MLCQNRANKLRALFDAQLSAVQRHIVRLNLPPFLAGVEAIIGASALILQPLLQSLGPLAVLFHNALCPEGHICMNEDLQNIGTVLQDKVRTPADNDAEALLCQIRNDIALNLPENILVGGAAVAVCQQRVQEAAGGTALPAAAQSGQPALHRSKAS